MSNPVSLFERLNKERPKPKDTEKPKLEAFPYSQSMDKYGRDGTSIDEYGRDKSGQVGIRQDNNVETSPSKNFTKTSNSIIKLAIPEKYFRGQSKHTYDVLYHRTRGAIIPVRQTQLSKTELVKLTGLAEKTVQLHIRYLRDSNLIAVHPQMGSHNGWVYEVFVPEELNNLVGDGQDRISMDKSSIDKTSKDRLSQNLSSQTMQNLSILSHTNTIENKVLKESPKTSLKTIENNDDEPFGKMNETLSKVFEKVSGKRPQKKDAEKLNEFAELIAMELEIAAARTKSISNVPAFLTEHLRRRLIGKSAAIEGKAKTSTPTKAGKQEETVEDYEAEPLTEQGREAVLKTIQEYIGKGQQEFVMSQQDTYTTDDWDWLMDKIKKGN